MKEKIKYLERFGKIKKRIKMLTFNISELRLNMLPSAIRYDVDRVQTSPSDRMVKYAEELDELERKLNVEIHRCNVALEEIENAIKSVDDEELQAILEGKYIFGKSYEQIGKQLGYSRRSIVRKHKDAIKKMKVGTPCHSKV